MNAVIAGITLRQLLSRRRTLLLVLLAGLIAGAGLQMSLAFTVATAVGSAVYAAIFVAVSLITTRALIFGLAYVLIWEGVLAGLFAGTQTFSVRQHTLAIADALVNVPSAVFSAPLPLGTALVVGGLVLVTALAIGFRRLARIEIAGETA
jgi:ABC-2 type transport system permease protein